ncbi:MAG: thiamine pyrophosphate-binding protein [Rhodospirillales bacterium]
MTDDNSTTGGRLIVEALLAHGVEVVFCVPGESYLEVLDALYEARDKIRLVTCRHENGAAYMAEAYAKLTGRAGVCLVTRGPGACNASIGIHTAFQDSTPVVLLIGQVSRPHIGREAFQEVDFKAQFKPLSKWADEMEKAAQAPGLIAEAFRQALSGRPGPAVLSMPEDLLGQSCGPVEATPMSVERPGPKPGDMERLHRMVADCRRPLMMVGGGGWTAKAIRDIHAFAAANRMAVCCSFRRHDLFDNRHPGFIGEMGIGPDPALIERFREADLLIVAGARLGEMTTQGYTLIEAPKPRQALVHVHPGAGELGRVFEPVLGIHSSMPAFAEAAAALAPAEKNRWLEWAGEARDDYEKNRVPKPPPGRLDLAGMMTWLDGRLPDDAVVTVDAGNFAGWPQRYLTFGGGRRLLGAANGSMGYGAPSAVAAAIVQPGRTVVGFAGDGGFAMTGIEVATAVHYRAKPLIVVFNNSMYGTIRMHQERRFPGRVIGTDLSAPDFAAMARSLGAFGERVGKTEDFAPAVERALKSDRAAVIELIVDPEIINTRTTLSEIRARAMGEGG